MSTPTFSNVRISRRQLFGGAFTAVAAAAVLGSQSRQAYAADFILYNEAGDLRVSVTRRTRSGRVECIVEEKNTRGVWEPVEGVEVLVRPTSVSGSFDIEKTDDTGLSLHDDYTYTSGMEIGVGLEGIRGTGILT